MNRLDTVPSVKSKIQAQYNSDPTNVKAVYLIGRVPVPYSGDIKPDGNANHEGAWPSDGSFHSIFSITIDFSLLWGYGRCLD